MIVDVSGCCMMFMFVGWLIYFIVIIRLLLL